MTASAVAAVSGGLFGDSAGLTSLTQISGRASNRRKAAQALASQATYPIRHILRTLDGVAPGTTSTKTWGQIDGSTAELGGVRTVNNINLVNRATISADVTETLADLLSLTTRTTFGASPPDNLDGDPLGTR